MIILLAVFEEWVIRHFPTLSRNTLWWAFSHKTLALSIKLLLSSYSSCPVLGVYCLVNSWREAENLAWHKSHSLSQLLHSVTGKVLFTTYISTGQNSDAAEVWIPPFSEIQHSKVPLQICSIWDKNDRQITCLSLLKDGRKTNMTLPAWQYGTAVPLWI